MAAATNTAIDDIMEYVQQRGKTYSLEEFKAELKLEVAPRSDLDENPDVSKCILALGEAGIGKTQSIRQAIEEIGGEYCMYHHGATMEEDNAGTPYQEQQNGDKVTKIAIPDHLACFYRKPQGSTGVLVVEEVFTGSTTAHQNQARQFIDRRFGLTRMKPGWHIVGTSNPSTADFHTVKAVDKALAKRMLWFPVKPTPKEKLDYWAGKMDDMLHRFLLLWHVEGHSMVEATDSRSWMNLSDSLARRRDPKNGMWIVETKYIKRLMTNHVGDTVANAFDLFLKKGNDPDEYPISQRELLEAQAKDMKTLAERIEKWTTEKRTSLIGATKWGICAYLKNGANHDKVKDRGVKNMATFMKLIGEQGYADLVDSMMSNIGKSPLAGKLLDELEGSSLYDKLEALISGDKPRPVST